jgi:hypothetical protein
MTAEEFSGGQPIKQLGLSAQQFSGGGSLSTDDSAALLGVTSSDTFKEKEQQYGVRQGIGDLAIGAVKQVAGDLQGIGKLPLYAYGKGFEAVTGDKSLTKAALESGIPGEDLEAKNTMQSIGKGLGIAAEVFAPGVAPASALEKIGLSGLYKAAESGLLNEASLKSISNIITSKWGKVALTGLQDFIGGAGVTAASKVGAGEEPTVGEVAGGGLLSSLASPLLRKVAGKIGGFFGSKTEGELSQDAYEKALGITSPKLSSKGQTEAFRQGRFSGKGTIEPSLPERKVAEAVQPLIESGQITPQMLKKNDLPAIRDIMAQEVSKTNQGVREMIANNNQPFNSNQLNSKLSELRKERIFPDKPAEQLYNKVVDKIKGFIGKKDTLGLFDARQEFDQYIKKTLGEKVFEKSDAASLAVRDARNAVNSYISELLPENNPYRPQLLRESDILSGIRQMSTKAPEMFKEANKSFLKKYPYIAASIGGAGIALTGEAIVGEAVKKITSVVSEK